jgi:predicted outer membrane repeat protein
LPCVEQGVRNAVAAGGGPYTFACEGPTTVTTEAEIVIGDDVILDGEHRLILDGGGSHRVLFVAIVSAELHRMTVTGGNAQGVEFAQRNGGGIYNTGYLRLTDSTVTGSTAEQYGGGIFNQWRGVSPDNSSVDLYQSTVSNNAAEFGGGIHSAADLSVVGTVVVGNQATRNGGGIYSTHSGSVIGSTVADNRARDHGGGIYGHLDLFSSTVSGNAAELGAGIYYTVSSTAVNSTVSSNTASARGGGIFNDIYADLTFAQINIWDNAAPQGRSIFSDGKPGPDESKSHPPPTGGGTVTMRGSLIEGDCHIEAPAEHISLGTSIESGSDTCGFDQATDQVNVTADALALGPLQDNGGPTMTHALGADSVAIDVIPQAECVDADGEPLTTDQRGFPRDSMCDVGAFEAQP